MTKLISKLPPELQFILYKYGVRNPAKMISVGSMTYDFTDPGIWRVEEMLEEDGE